MLFIFKTGTYFMIILYNKLELTFKSYLFNAFLIFLPPSYIEENLRLFLKINSFNSLELTLKLSWKVSNHL